MRYIIPAQLDPAVAAAIKYVEPDWLIVINPGLSPRGRAVAEAEAHQYLDAFEMGWSYTAPAGGVDVCIADDFMSVAAVVVAS